MIRNPRKVTLFCTLEVEMNESISREVCLNLRFLTTFLNLVMKEVVSPLYIALLFRVLDHHVFPFIIGPYQFLPRARVTHFPLIYLSISEIRLESVPNVMPITPIL